MGRQDERKLEKTFPEVKEKVTKRKSAMKWLHRLGEYVLEDECYDTVVRDVRMQESSRKGD